MLSCFFGGLISEDLFFDMSRVENIIWNNKEIKINNKPVFYANYCSLGIICLRDLLFEYDNVAS